MDKTTAGCYIVTVLVGLQAAAWYMGKNGTITALITGVIAAIAAYIFGYNRGGKVKAPEIPEFPTTKTIKPT